MINDITVSKYQVFGDFWEHNGPLIIARLSPSALDRYSQYPDPIEYIANVIKPLYYWLLSCNCVTCKERNTKGHVLIHSGPECHIPANPIVSLIQLLDQTAEGIEVLTPIR